MRARHAVTSLVLLALAVPVSRAEPPKLAIPAELIPKNGYATYTPPADVVSIKYKSLSGLFPVPAEILGDKRVLCVPTAREEKGRYKFYAVGSNAKGELADCDFEIVIGDAPKPPPGPKPPDPKPPEPDPLSPLAKKFAEAYAKETAADRRERLAALVEVMAWATLNADKPAYDTTADLTAAVSKYRTEKIGDALPAVRAAIGNHLNDKFGKDPFKLNADTRTRVVTAYSEVAVALREVMK